MTKQIKGFNEAYRNLKKRGFENYFCLPNTTWKEANENFKKGMVLEDEISIMKLQENVDITIMSSKGEELPVCDKCKQFFSPQEFKAGFKTCEHCERKQLK